MRFSFYYFKIRIGLLVKTTMKSFRRTAGSIGDRAVRIKENSPGNGARIGTGQHCGVKSSKCLQAIRCVAKSLFALVHFFEIGYGCGQFCKFSTDIAYHLPDHYQQEGS